MAYCPHCGTQVPDGDSLCPSCGKTIYNAPVQNRTAPGNDEKWLVTLLLCFFLGGLGIHRFYTGHTKTGIEMLLTMGGSGVWALVDFIMIICNSYVDGNGNRLK